MRLGDRLLLNITRPLNILLRREVPADIQAGTAGQHQGDGNGYSSALHGGGPFS